MAHICSEDSRENAVCCCSCSAPPVPLCEFCVCKHEVRPGFHFILPLRAIELVPDLATRDSWNRHLFVLKQRQDAMWAQYRNFKASEEKIHSLCAEVVDLIESVKNELVQRFRGLRKAFKAEIQKSVWETREYLLDGLGQDASTCSQMWLSPNETNLEPWLMETKIDFQKLSSSLQVHVEFSLPELKEHGIHLASDDPQLSEIKELRAKVEMLTKQLEKESEDSRSLKRSLTFSINSAAQNSQTISASVSPKSGITLPKLPCLISNSLGFFDCRTEMWGKVARLREKVVLTEWSSYVFIPSTAEVLACGGGEIYSAVKTTFRVSSNGSVKKLADMNCPRFEHSIVLLNASVHAFGGNPKSAEKQVETYSLEADQWTVRKPMHKPRRHFVATVWNDCVFLCGGKSSQGSIEVFFPESGNSSLLPIRLKENGSALAFRHSDSLVVLTTNFIVRYEVVADSLNEQEVTRHSMEQDVWSNAVPVVCGNKVFAIEDTTCHYYDVYSGQKENEKRMETGCNVF